MMPFNTDKAKKAVVGAVMRKLVHIVYGVLKIKQFFKFN